MNKLKENSKRCKLFYYYSCLVSFLLILSSRVYSIICKKKVTLINKYNLCCWIMWSSNYCWLFVRKLFKYFANVYTALNRFGISYESSIWAELLALNSNIKLGPLDIKLFGLGRTWCNTFFDTVWLIKYD